MASIVDQHKADQTAPLSPFGEVLSVGRTPVVSLSSIYPLSLLRNVTQGSVAHTGPEYQVAADSVLESAEIGRYVPGYAAECGVGIRVPALQDGQTARWGYFDAANGFLFAYDADGLWAVRRRSGVDNATLLETSADPADGHVWQIRFSWYGYGRAEWMLVDPSGRRQTVETLHHERVAGETSVADANLPIRVENDTAGSVYVGGRQFSIVGDYRPNVRINAADNQAVAVNTWAPVCSFRRVDTSQARSVSIGVEGFATVADNDHEVAIVVGADLTGASWVTPDFSSGDDSAIEVDRSATDFAGGTSLWRDLFAATGSGGNRRGGGEESLGTRVPRLSPVTLLARTPIDVSASVSAVLRAVEEW